MAQLRGGAVLKAQVSKLLPGSNESVDLTAQMELAGQALPIREAKALIRYPDGRTEIVGLIHGGDQWKATFKPTASGVYGINIQVSGSTLDGAPLEREAFLSVQGQPSARQVATSQRWISVVVLFVLAAIVVLILGSLVRRRAHKA